MLGATAKLPRGYDTNLRPRPTHLAPGTRRTWRDRDAKWRPEWGVGFNPYRPVRRRASDYAMVVAALLVVTLLLVWAFTG